MEECRSVIEQNTVFQPLTHIPSTNCRQAVKPTNKNPKRIKKSNQVEARLSELVFSYQNYRGLEIFWYFLALTCINAELRSSSHNSMITSDDPN